MANATPNEKTHAGNVQVPFDRKKVMSGKPRLLHCKKIFLIAVSIVMPAMYACAELADESLPKVCAKDFRSINALQLLDLVASTNDLLSAEIITNLPAKLVYERYNLVYKRCEDLDASLRYLRGIIGRGYSILNRLEEIHEGGKGKIILLRESMDMLCALIDEFQGLGSGCRFKDALQKGLNKIEIECPYPEISKVESDNLARECDVKVKDLQRQMKKLLRGDSEIIRMQGRIKKLKAKYREKISQADKHAKEEFALKLERRRTAISEFRDKFCKLVRLAVLEPMEGRLDLHRRMLLAFSHERDIIDRILSDWREIEERKQLRAEAMEAAVNRVKRLAEQQQAVKEQQEQLRKQQEQLRKQEQERAKSYEELIKSYLTLLQENGMEEVSCIIYKEDVLVFCYKRGEEIVSLSYDTRSREQDLHGSISKELAANLIAMRLQINEFQKSSGGKDTHD